MSLEMQFILDLLVFCTLNQRLYMTCESAQESTYRIFFIYQLNKYVQISSMSGYKKFFNFKHVLRGSPD